jgi:lysophospholipase
VQYSKFRRQGLDIICATFLHKKGAKANLIFLTGLTESFLKYSEVIQYYFEHGFNIFTYDHQSQCLSGRWLTESQSIWIHTFEDYVDDFVYFATTITKDSPSLPIFLLAHSMGGFIASIAMARLPSLIQRAVLCAPMLRNKCGNKASHYQYPLPQPLTYWIVSLLKYIGLGSMHTIGFFKEKPTDKIPINVYTSDAEQLTKWEALRMKYPNHMITTCITNDWVYHSIRAQKKFAERYSFVKTNTLILSAEIDYLVNNRAMAMFIRKAPNTKMFNIPGSYHEILYETEAIRDSAMKCIYDFFNQKSDDISLVLPCYPLVVYDQTVGIYSMPELIVRGVGIGLSVVSLIAGVVMILGGDRKK